MANVVALEPWHGGSHARFLEGWVQHSRNDIEVLGLPARNWKWRMEGSPWQLARRLEGRELPDVLWISDYVDLARLRGLAPQAWRNVPAALYFHENQLTYPVGEGQQRDLSHGFTNLLSLLCAEGVAFNSAFHRRSFGDAARKLLGALPRPTPRQELERALQAARVLYPGIDRSLIPTAAPGGPLRVVFNQRLEHDKDPLTVFEILADARRAGAVLEVVILGESYRKMPTGVAPILESLADCTVHRGHVDDLTTYWQTLAECDVVLSAAQHEFYGIAVLEAVAAGCQPLLPRRLAYPELFSADSDLYDSPAEAVRRLVTWSRDPAQLRLPAARAAQSAKTEGQDQRRAARALDDWIDEVASPHC